MKAKTKPVKGSARTQKFDRGGTVAALAGLGTLAYLMSRKKKGAAGETGKGMGKFPMEAGDGTSGPGMDEYKPKDDAAKQRAMAASMGRPEMGDATNDDITTKKTTTPVVKKTTTPVVKKTAPAAKVTAPAPKVTAPAPKVTAPAPKATPDMGKPNEERPSKPYPEKEAAAMKAVSVAARTSRPGDPDKKAATSKVAKATQGTVEQAGRSMARTPAQKMAENARLVEERRKKEKAEKMGYGIKNGGAVKKYADGGMTSSKPAPKKAPMPAFAREAKENRERDQRVKKEREEFDKGAPTRLKDQGSFKHGGMTASKRGDGIAMRGKTNGKMY
jgi:hypothetical protein